MTKDEKIFLAEEVDNYINIINRLSDNLHNKKEHSRIARKFKKRLTFLLMDLKIKPIIDYHIGCRNYPNCDMFGCGEHT